MDSKKAVARDSAEGKPDALRTGTEGTPSSLTCPECGGSLNERQIGKLVQYRCHVGHAYTAESLLSGQADSLEAALWTALRALEENAALRRRMSDRMKESGANIVAEQYAQQAKEVMSQADAIRAVL